MRRALVALLVLSPAPASEQDGGGDAPSLPLTEQQLYGRDVLARVAVGEVWAPPLLSIAVSTAFDLFADCGSALEEFADRIRAAVSEIAPYLESMAARGDLDPSAADLQLVREAAAGTAPAPLLGGAVEAAINLYRKGVGAPLMRLFAMDCRTPYSVPVGAPTVFAALIQPYGYDDDDGWEYDLGSLSPDLATLRSRLAGGFIDFGDAVLMAYAEVRLEPVAGNAVGGSQTEISTAAIRSQGEAESYDLHSFTAARAGISETVTDYPIDPHPCGPITRETTVRLVLIREIPLDPSL